MGNGPDNVVLGARVTGERRERYEAAKEGEDGEISNADFLRALIDDGLDHREKTVYERLGCEDWVSARLEAERGPEESRERVIARFLAEAIELHDQDELDALGAGDDLRDRVEAAAEEDEPLDVTIRHLLRDGLERVENENSKRNYKQRLASAIVIGFLSGFPVIYALAGEYRTAAGMILIFVLAAVFAEEINSLFERLESFIGRSWQKLKR